MNKLYEKSKIWFAIAWIICYCVLASVGDYLSESVGIAKIFTFPILAVLSISLFLFIKKNDLLDTYGLCKAKVPTIKVLFYIPLCILLTVNFWYGFSFRVSPTEAVLYVLSMLFVGFLEEMIFRGFLFHAMLEKNTKSAIIVSSVTFGIGHIINLINGSGTELLPNLLQVIYAMATGFMFMMLYYRTKSLIPCIVTHSLFNALSLFSNEAIISVSQKIFSCVFITIISGAYALYLTFGIKNVQKE